MSTLGYLLVWAAAGFLGVSVWRLGVALWNLFRLVDTLNAERELREKQLTEVTGELDLRIRRMQARENYYRQIAEDLRRGEPLEEDKESPLEVRERLRAARRM